MRIKFIYYGILVVFIKSCAVKIGEKKIRILTMTSHERNRAVSFFRKEPETLRWIDSFKAQAGGDQPAFVFFDIGANIGIYSMYAAVKYPKAKVISFEPESQSFSSLCKNASSNDLVNINPYQFAISDNTGIGKIWVSLMSAGAGAASLGGEYELMKKKNNTIFHQGVYYASIDDLVFNSNFPFPAFIKVDVDGIEGAILSGARRVMNDDRFKSLLVEIQFKAEGDVSLIDKPLRAMGLRLLEKSEWTSFANGFYSRNFIYGKVA